MHKCSSLPSHACPNSTVQLLQSRAVYYSIAAGSTTPQAADPFTPQYSSARYPCVKSWARYRAGVAGSPRLSTLSSPSCEYPVKQKKAWETLAYCAAATPRKASRCWPLPTAWPLLQGNNAVFAGQQRVENTRCPKIEFQLRQGRCAAAPCAPNMRCQR